MLENEISMPYTEKKKFSFGEIINNNKKKNKIKKTVICWKVVI